MGSDVLVLDREQALLDIVRALPQASIEELLDFALFLKQRTGFSMRSGVETQNAVNADLRAETVYEIYTPSYDMTGAANALLRALESPSD